MADSMAVTHIRNKTGEKVVVERQYGIVIVKTTGGKVLGSYEATEMAKFHQRYTKIDRKKKAKDG